MWSETLDKTVITDNWQIFSKKLFQHFIYHKKILKVTKFQFKIVCRSRVLDKNIFEPSKLIWIFFQSPGSITCLLYDVYLHRKKQKKLMIRRSSSADGWKDEQSQIYRTLLSGWVSNLFLHHGDVIDFQLQYVLVRLGVESFVSQCLWYKQKLQSEGKHQFGEKPTKMTTK